MEPVAAKKPLRRISGERTRIVIPISVIEQATQKSTYKSIIDKYAKKVKSPKSAIRAKCIECSGGSWKEVQMCMVKSCALYPFREGVNPFHSKTRERLARESGETMEEDNDEPPDEIDESGDSPE